MLLEYLADGARDTTNTSLIIAVYRIRSWCFERSFGVRATENVVTQRTLGNRPFPGDEDKKKKHEIHVKQKNEHFCLVQGYP